MLRFLLFGWLLLNAGFLYSQKLLVKDQSSDEPIEHVAIYNLEKTRTSLTSNNGIADISNFLVSDYLIFQHPSFEDKVIEYKTLYDKNFIIFLEKKTINLEEFVVSVNKWEQKREEVPNKISSIRLKEIEYENSQTSADLIGSNGEVFIQKSQLGGGSPMLRGFSANSILLMMDGVRMNNAIFRSGNLQNVITVDANSIGEAEVIFGPGSVIYGSDALGGVIDFHTHEILFPSKDTSEYKINLLTRYATASKEKTVHFDINYGTHQWGLLTSVSLNSFDDLRMGKNGLDEYLRNEYVGRIEGRDTILQNENSLIQKYSGYNQINFLQKIQYRPSDYSKLDYGFYYTTSSNIPRYDRLIEYSNDALKYAVWEYGPQQWLMNKFSFENNKKNVIFDRMKILFAWQDLEESRIDRKYENDIKRTRVENLNVINTNIDFEKSLSDINFIFYGIDSYFNLVNSTGEKENIVTKETEPTNPRYPDGGSDYYSAAAYVHFKSNFHQKFTFQTGLRYSYIYLNSRFDNKDYYPLPDLPDAIGFNTGALNGSIGLVYRPSKGWQLNTNLSSGFRAPNVDDMAKIFDSEPGNVVVPNADLKPEYAYNVDFAVLKNFSKKLKIDVSAFYTYLVNVMVRQDFTYNGSDYIMYDDVLSKVRATVNAGSGQIYGFSGKLSSEINDYLHSSINLNYIKGLDENDEPLRHVTPLFGKFIFGYHHKGLKADFYVNYSGELSYEDLSSSERKKPHIYATDKNGNPYAPAWYTLNLRTSIDINEYFTADLGVENIANQRYRPYSSGIVASGRNIIVALRLNL